MLPIMNAEFGKPEDFENVLKSLEILTKQCLDSDKRNLVDDENFINLEAILESSLKNLIDTNEIWIEAFRFLRNSVAASSRNQNLIREKTKLTHVTKSFLELNCSSIDIDTRKNEIDDNDDGKINEGRLPAIRCSLQFLANLMVDNSENNLLVSSLFPSCLGKIMCEYGKDEKVIQYASMVVHLSMKCKPEFFLESSKIFEILLNNLQLEFAIYPMESLVKLKEFAEFYKNLEPKPRIKILSFLNSRPDLLKYLDLEIISVLKASFIERADFILGSKLGDSDDLFSWEIAVLLEFLCVCSAEAKVLQSDPALLTTVLCLLKQIHDVGKSSSGNDSVFSPVEDLSKLTTRSTTDCDTNDIRAHPTFQFKAHLIRLVANLSHRNRLNQDKVRDLECLPIILDNCKLDARNPFIAQWSILAIRNLCEGNNENQEYIREVQRIDTEKLLPKLELVDVS